VLYAIHTVSDSSGAEAVGNVNLSVAVLGAVHLDLLYQELHQFTALCECLASVLFDLLDTLPERQEARLGGLCRQLVLFFRSFQISPLEVLPPRCTRPGLSP
jgi:hypothetical protein